MAAVQIIISIIPIIGIVMGSILIFFYLLWRHRQIMRQIETRTYIPFTLNITLFCLLLGIILTITGAFLFILFYLIEHISYVLLGGLIPFTLGISLLIFYHIIEKNQNKYKTDATQRGLIE